jgi:predicted flap endonuclease-1-like 5' DNA nuclease
MPNHYNERWEGPIRGFRLPMTAWNRLADEGITTFNQLKAVADQLERFEGIGPKTAEVIRGEIARIAASEEQPSAVRPN